MLRNYLLIGLRNLRKHLTYSLINIVGLGLGLATCLLLISWIRLELSYDTFHEKSEQLYRTSLEYSFGGQTNKTSVSPTALLPAMQKNFPEVESGVRVYNPSSYSPYIIRKDDKLFQEGKFYFADSTFFTIFSFKLSQGDKNRVLTAPKSVVLTQSMARKYFGSDDPIGEVLQINNRAEYTVTGVMEDAPTNSLLKPDFIASFSTLDAARELIWWSANYETFIRVAPQTDVAALEAKTNTLVKKELASELTNPNDYVRYNFIRMTDIYLRSEMNESEIVSSINYIYAFSAIAALIMLIACINYINLATARAADRAKEVGIRKVVGAIRKQLFLQFIGESIIVTGLAFVFAFVLANVTLPIFNMITGKYLSPGLLMDPFFISWCLLGLVLIAITAGAYPALAITSYKPVSVLKGNFKSSNRGIWLRQGLVVFQFCISIILIVGTLVILKQLDYLQNTRLGYDKENVILLPLDRKTDELYGQLRTELLRSGIVSEVARATESPTKIRGGYSINLEGATGDRGMIVTAMTADSSFIPALGMELATGRNFNTADQNRYKSDTIHSFILNESAIKELALNLEQVIGTRINLNGRKGEIVGVVKDFHFASLHTAISPMVLFNEEGQFNVLFVKLKSGNVADALKTLKTICSQVIPHRPFEYEFLDQKYESLYSSEQQIGTISAVFASLAIVIACLGLFGLVAFAAAQKTKEIGIRKVMGATAANIVLLITRDYSRLVIISIAIGLPAAWWVIDHWFLSNFVYRVPVGAGPFAIAAISCIIISFGTASYQAIKAALVNPTESLRGE